MSRIEMMPDPANWLADMPTLNVVDARLIACLAPLPRIPELALSIRPPPTRVCPAGLVWYPHYVCRNRGETVADGMKQMKIDASWPLWGAVKR